MTEFVIGNVRLQQRYLWLESVRSDAGEATAVRGAAALAGGAIRDACPADDLHRADDRCVDRRWY